jgi:hypothetical protein
MKAATLLGAVRREAVGDATIRHSSQIRPLHPLAGLERVEVVGEQPQQRERREMVVVEVVTPRALEIEARSRASNEIERRERDGE